MVEYTIKKLGKMAGISTRTLRYYDEIGLLCPARISSNGYRIYGQQEIDRLQQILFYRELGVELDEIKKILSDLGFDTVARLESHLTALSAKQERLTMLIVNVKKTISAKKGEIIMNNNEKFEGFKQNLLDENEQKYGAEIREKYGDDVINASNAKLKGMTQKEYADLEKLNAQLNETLKAAFELGDPASELAQEACELHKQWLCFYNPNYSKEYHRGLGEMYALDERFKAYYDIIAEGCAEFLRDAINIYCK